MNDKTQPDTLQRRLLSGGAWTLSGKLVTAFAGFIVNAIIARLISPQEVGAFFLLVSLVNVATLVSLLGLQIAIVRLVAEAMGSNQAGKARALISAVLRIGSFSATGIAVVVGLSGGLIAIQLFNSPIIASVVWYAPLWIISLAILTLMVEAFRGLHDFRLATVFGGGVTNLLTVGLLMAVLVLQGKSNLSSILILSIVSSILSLLLAAYVMKRKFSTLGKPVETSSHEILKIGLPLMLSNLAIFFTTQADLWVIGMFGTINDVAIYGTAIRLGQLVYIPLLISNMILPPFISEMYSQGKIRQLENVIRVTSSLSAIPAVFMLMVFIFSGDSILALIYGEYYRDASFPLAVMSAGQLVNVWSGSGMVTLMMTGHQRAVMNISLISGFLIVAGAILTVKPFGIYGVAVSTGLITATQALFVLFWVKRKTNMWTHFGTASLYFATKKFIQAK